MVRGVFGPSERLAPVFPFLPVDAKAASFKVWDMKVISIRQPWAWLIIHAGKDIENRDWCTNYRGPVAIHASKHVPTPAEISEIELAMKVQIRRLELRYGGIIGTAEITDCVSQHASPWFFEGFGFVLVRPRPVRFHPLAGKLGLFDAPGYVPEYVDQGAPVKVTVVS